MFWIYQYAKVERARLQWVRENQRSVKGLLDAVDNVGHTAILPASIIGTPRWYCGPGQPHIGQGDGQANLLPHTDLQPQVARHR